ncbi:hypothetical protein ABPG73_022864 [Tetrahymena malaccensis]
MREFILIQLWMTIILLKISYAQNRMPGNGVRCSINFTDCKGCGSNEQIQSYFDHASGIYCSIADCNSSVIASSINGWGCKSCSTVNGSSVLQQGQYYDPNSKNCTNTCPQGMQASFSTNYICVAPGSDVSCSVNSTDCSGCGSTTEIQSLFKFTSGTIVALSTATANKIIQKGQYYDPVGKQCTDSCPQGTQASSSTGFICQIPIIPGSQFYDGSSCVNSCPNGQIADASTGYICKPTQPAIVAAGKPVSCSTDKSTCKSCEKNPSLQNFFQYSSQNQCQVIDCQSPKLLQNLNSWTCASCDGVSGSKVPSGKCYDGSTCTSTCQISCAQNQGGLISCSSDSQSCRSCEISNTSNNFAYSSGDQCYVKDCSNGSIPALNGWICKSCYTATGNDLIYQAQYYDPSGGFCSSSCSNSDYANFNTGYTCTTPIPGKAISCSNDSKTCSGCEPANLKDSLFTYISGSKCSVIDCRATVIGKNINGWICSSCNTDTGNQAIKQGQYYDPNSQTCTDTCPQGTQASISTGLTCLPTPIPGSDVSCSINSTNCSGCGSTTTIQSLFKFTSGTSCQITDCTSTVIGKNLNGWVCNSCSTAAGSNIIQKGQFYDPVSNQCMDSCPQGTQANSSTGFVCQPLAVPGINVNCSNDSSTCSGCGSTTDIQNLFGHNSGSSCSIKDCTASVIGNNLNGWVCNSCSTASGKNIIATGQFYDGSSCVSSCPNGQIADSSTGYVCKPIQVASVAVGNPVTCSSDKSTCKSCEKNPSLQNFFQYYSQDQCKVIDCSSPKLLSNLNRWTCASCDGVPGSKVPSGKYYDGSTCISTCESNNFIHISSYIDCVKAINQTYAQNKGGLVSCSKDSTSCSACEASNGLNYFTYSSGDQCFVKDCSASTIKSLNGFICNSCSTATGNNSIHQGQYYQQGSNSCIGDCGEFQYANFYTNYVCVTPIPGKPTSCSNDSQTCSGCQPATLKDSLFTYKSGSNCFVTDCNASVIGNNINGWICNSCNTDTGASAIKQGQYYDPNSKTCTDTCPQGTQASSQTGMICLPPPNPGINVDCSINSQNCNGCGSTTEIQSLFLLAQGTKCYVKDCTSTVIGKNLNGWVCNSCSGANGSNVIQKGQFYDPVSNQCIDSCPQGTQASADFICQPLPVPGINVNCSNDSSTCSGCGSTKDIQNLFAHSSGSSCSIKDCTATVIGNNLNGWVCNSCSKASGKNVIATGQFYDGSSCVSSCPNGQKADESTGYICKPIQAPSVVVGNPVSCSTDKSTCTSCEKNPSLQNFFQYNSQNQCQVMDCSSPKLLSNLNRWTCASCNGVPGSKIPSGKYYDGSTCISTCDSKNFIHISTYFDCVKAINYSKITEFFFLLIATIFLS